MRVPDDWDLTGFSGSDAEGYFRADDGVNRALEVKWATDTPKTTLPFLPKLSAEALAPDVTVRRESYFKVLRDTAKKKKLAVITKDTDAPRGVTSDHPERSAAGFTWTGDKRGVGVVWFCATCRRVTIAQVTGDVSGKSGLTALADALLGSLACHDLEPNRRVWAIYDLQTVVPTGYVLTTAQLMNVYLRLSFANRTARLSVEQWSVANVARKTAYLDDWVSANAKGELSEARYRVSEGVVHDGAAVQYTGGPAWGQPMLDVVKEATRFQRPATRFTGLAWEDDVANKIYLVSARRPAREADVVDEVATATGSSNGEERNGGHI